MSWINEAVIYNIYPLGFSGAPRSNDFNTRYRLDKIYDFIPHFKKLGINAIVFNPVFESTKHGYDTIDYKKIDSRLGDNNSFKKICDTLHENGIRVLLDGVFNHVGRDFFAFKDVQQYGMSSIYCSWFMNLDFSRQSPYGDDFNYEPWAGYYDLVKLNLSNEDVVNHLIDAVKYWMDEFKIDGLRLDAADVIDINFFKRLRYEVKQKNSDFWMYGEIVGGDYNRLANCDTLDSVTNYEIYKPLFSACNDRNCFEFAHSMDREYGDWGIYKNLYLYNFVDNHDTTRIASILNDKSLINNIYTELFCMPGVPSIYYGSEFALEGFKTNNSDDDVRKELSLNNLDNPRMDVFEHICKLSKIRHSLNALKYGKYHNEVIQLEHLCYSMRTDDQCVYVLINQSGDYRDISFGTGFDGYLTDVLNNNEKFECHDWVNISVPPKSSRILIANDGSYKIEFSDDNDDYLSADNNTETEPKITLFDIEEDNENYEIEPGKYRHFKGNEYEVSGFAIHSETEEKMVIYKALYGDYQTYVRPYEMFKEFVDTDKGKVRRFQKI